MRTVSQRDPIGTAAFFQVATIVELHMLSAPQIVGATLSVQQPTRPLDGSRSRLQRFLHTVSPLFARTLSRHMPMRDLALQTAFRAKFFSAIACCFCMKLPLLCLYHEGLDTDGASSCLLPFHMRSVSSWREDFLPGTIRETDNHSLLCFALLLGSFPTWPSCG